MNSANFTPNGKIGIDNEQYSDIDSELLEGIVTPSIENIMRPNSKVLKYMDSQPKPLFSEARQSDTSDSGFKTTHKSTYL